MKVAEGSRNGHHTLKKGEIRKGIGSRYSY